MDVPSLPPAASCMAEEKEGKNGTGQGWIREEEKKERMKGKGREIRGKEMISLSSFSSFATCITNGGLKGWKNGNGQGWVREEERERKEGKLRQEKTRLSLFLLLSQPTSQREEKKKTEQRE